MSKVIVNMSDWDVYVYEGEYNLSGIADNHPRLGRNVYISYTSTLEHSEFKDDILTYETRNTIYVCPLKYMRIENLYRNVVHDYVVTLANLYKKSDNDLDLIISASAQISLGTPITDLAKHILDITKDGHKELQVKIEEENNRLKDIVKHYTNAVYIEVSNIDCGDKLAYNIDGELGVICPSIHSGMFQDSILYRKWNKVDFRYFPNWNSMKTYSWSENIEKAVIRNIISEPIRFNGTIIGPNELVECYPTSHTNGLLSPNCVPKNPSPMEDLLTQDEIEKLLGAFDE